MNEYKIRPKKLCTNFPYQIDCIQMHVHYKNISCIYYTNACCHAHAYRQRNNNYNKDMQAYKSILNC